MNKFKFLLNIDDKNEQIKNNIQNIQKNNLDNIYELINNSMNNDNLKKKTIDYEAWF